jgi:hypothetical protein
VASSLADVGPIYPVTFRCEQPQQQQHPSSISSSSTATMTMDHSSNPVAAVPAVAVAGAVVAGAIDEYGVVNCSALLEEVMQEIRWDPNKGELFLRYTKLHPQFWISIHNFAFDKVRYGTLQWGKYYEKALSQAFVSVLDAPEKSLVIDVGGNIGWFSLLSAAMGHDVHVFEPNVVNVHRMCESICLNGWEPCDTTLGLVVYHCQCCPYSC